MNPKGNRMKPMFVLLSGLSLIALVAAGCAPSAPTPPTPPKAAAPTAAAPAPKAPEPAPTAAAPAPIVEAPKAPEPAPAEAPSVTIKAVDEKTGKVALTFKAIYFDYDKYTIRPEFKSAIESNAADLKKVPDLKVVIEGHCDERGTTEYNLALGEHRAVAVMRELAAAGVSKARLKTVSFGKERPVDPGHTEDAWAKNRRGIVRES